MSVCQAKCLALFAVPESIEASAAGLETKLERLMAAKGSSFEKEVAYRASQAAGMVWYESCCGLPPVHLPHLCPSLMHLSPAVAAMRPLSFISEFTHAGCLFAS